MMEGEGRLRVLAYLLWCGTFASAEKEPPSPPMNLTLTDILSNTVVVTWDADVSEKLTLFEMTIRPLSDSPRIVTAHLDGRSRSYLVQALYPGTEYELFILAHNGDGVSNVSDVVTFRTLQVTPETLHQPDIHPGEAIIVCFILVAWFCAIALFLHKWGKLRIIQSDQPRYNHKPKNIETIKVVKRSSDSIIHKSYSSQVSKTMVARQKRIERMNTMPNIKINLNDSPPKSTEGDDQANNCKTVESQPDTKGKHKYKIFSRTITSPLLELEEPKVVVRVNIIDEPGIKSPVLELKESVPASLKRMNDINKFSTECDEIVLTAPVRQLNEPYVSNA